MEILLGWAIAGVIGGLIGQIRERPLYGCVLGLLLGPIGWLIALFLQKQDETGRDPT